LEGGEHGEPYVKLAIILPHGQYCIFILTLKALSSMPTTTPATTDLTDAEFAELDTLLTQTPEPLQSVDVVMLDGFLCGVLAQPVQVPRQEWLAFVFDFDGQALPETVDAQWYQQTLAYIERRYAALDRALTQDAWFNPLILEADDEAPDAPPSSAPDEADALAGLGDISLALMPWVAGFQHAMLCFPQLEDLQQEAIGLSLVRLFRHLPADSAEEKEILALMDREQPLASLEEAVEDLVNNVVDLVELGRTARYRVSTVRRTSPKPGRNDPCFCGSGKKHKQCHGKGA
jgi:uncharacterized protein